LVDEAHHLPDRARDMLSATLDSHILRIFRRDIGKQYGRKHGFYPALGRLIRSIESMPGRPDNHAAFCSDVAPDTLGSCLEACMDAAMALLSTSSPMASAIAVIARDLFSAQATLARFGAGYTLLCQPLGPQELCMTLFCLDPAPHLRAYTKRLHGSVFFSATLTPLCAYRTLLGGDTEDALLSIPSPFPRENLLVLRRSISTRYQDRESTAEIVARTIGVCAQQHPGNYLACFPSYQYVTLVQDCMQRLFPDLPLRVQQSGMQDAQRADFLAAFAPRTDDTLLGMIVLGGVFGEGIDLPGDRLCGVMVVGVALPQISFACETLRAYYESALGDGFAYAYMYPGMNKVLQAVGRVIRTETDR
ncbi:MAG: ATP-dependent DNA helicase, partial [Clostridia bacterium]